ncbi:hypothetical protein DFH27DRAFT_528854 [Peziza echinospora]|nr:hypothetical protein DFH27DRAFT_528854 [Peziza echinospora]
MVLLEQFLEEFNMFVQLQLVALLYHHYRAYMTCSFECKWLHCPTITVGTQDKHSNVTLSEWNLGLLDSPNRLHQVLGLQLGYWWSCAQHGSKPPCSHILECKQHMVNHQYGVVGAVPGGFQHVCSIAAGCTALPSLLVSYNIIQLDLHALFQQVSSLEPTSTHDKHFNVTLSEKNLGLLDMFVRLQLVALLYHHYWVPGLQLEYWWSCAQRGSKPPWSHILECKQHMVNHQYGVVGAVPGGVQHVRSNASGCTALPSLSVVLLNHCYRLDLHGSFQCKQHLVNHQYGVVGAVPGGVQHVCSIAAGCTALPSLSGPRTSTWILVELCTTWLQTAMLAHTRVQAIHGQPSIWCCWSSSSRTSTCLFDCRLLQSSSITIGQVSYNIIQVDLHALFRKLSTLEPTSTQDKHSNVTLSEWNLGLLDMFVQMQVVALLYHRYWSASSTWSTKNMVLLEQFLEEFNMFVPLQLVALLYHHYRSNVILSEWNLGLLDMFVRMQVVALLYHRYRWSHCSTIAIGGRTALPSLLVSSLEPTSTQDKHSNVTPSEWNLGLLDMFVRMQVVALLYHRYRTQARKTNTPMSHFQSGIWLHCSTITIGLTCMGHSASIITRTHKHAR